MNEIIPPSEPGKPPPTPATPKLPYKSGPPSKKMCAFYGFLLFIVTCPFSFIVPPLAMLGLVGAIASLFFKGYRCIFVGYLLTVGVLLLGAIVWCSMYPVRFD